MPVASYQQSNDYSLVDRIKPLNLPYESTMQEIATKTQYWKVGADNVKSAYDRAVNLDPQFVQNRDYLKNFMDQANKNLQKINKSDLGVFDNSLEATKIFDPLYDTKNPFNYRLLADSQINKHYQKQQKLSETYRTKDGGKEWNQNNDFYYRDAQQKYTEDAKNGNLESIDTHLQKRKSFIPYYDFKKEMLDIQEACKGQSYTNKSIANNNQLYFVENSKSGCTPQELALAFKTGLSDRAKQQMQIDGYVHFKGNEDELAKQFADIQVNKAQTNVDNIKATIAGIKDGGVSKNEIERLKFYEAQLSILEPELKESKDEFEKMTKGNVYEYVNNNYDKLAGQVYYNNLTSQLAQAYRTDDPKNIVSTNPAGMLQLKLETERADMYIKANLDAKQSYRNHLYDLDEITAKGEVDKELARLKGELKDGENSNSNSISGSVPTTIDPVTGKNVSIKTVNEQDFIKQELEPAKQKATTNYNVVDDLIRKQLGKKDKKLNNQEIINYVTELENKQKNGKILSQDGTDILEAYSRYKDSKDDLSFVNDQIAAADAVVKRDHPELFKDKEYDNSKFSNYSLTFFNNSGLPETADISLSQKDIYDLSKGKEVKGLKYNSKAKNNVDPKYYFNGKSVISENTQGSTLDLAMLNIQGDNIKNQKEIDKYKTQFYTDNNYINSQLTQFNKMDFGKPEDFENKYGSMIKQYFNVNGGLGDKNGYEIVGRDKFGSGAYVRLLDEDAKPILLDLKQNFANLSRYKNKTQISIDDNLRAFYIKDFLPEYSNLPDRKTLDKFNKVEYQVRNIVESLQQNKQFVNAVTIDSRELSAGGTVRYVGGTGIEYLISVYKEQGQPLMYIASYTAIGGSEEKFKGQTVDQLLAKLSEVDRLPK